MSITSDEVNYLVYRYLLESGFGHSAFTFAHESLVVRTPIAESEVPPGALLAFLQKGLQYVEIETHLQEDGTERQCDEPFHLLAPHICRLKSVAGRKGGSDDVGTTATSMVPEIPASDVSVLSGHSSEVFVCAFNPTTNVLATGSADGTARLWHYEDAGAGAECNTLRHSTADSKSTSKDKAKDVASLDWSPDGSRLATGCYDAKARIFSADGGLQHVLTGHTQPIFAVQWSPSGNQVLTGSVDNTAILWDANAGSMVQQFAYHAAAILDVDWANNTQFATCSSDKSIQVWTVGDRVPSRSWEGHTDEVNCIQWNPAKQLLASGSDDGTARVWSVSAAAENGCVSVLSGHKKSVYSVKWSPTGEGSANPDLPSILATASFDSTVKLWDAQSGKQRNTLAKHSAMVYALAFSPSGEYVVSGSSDRSVHVWSTRDGSLLRTLNAPSGVFDINFNKTGDKLGICCANSSVLLVDMKM